MKITETEAFLMSFPLSEPLRLSFWGGERTILKRDAMLIRLKTDTGLVGYAPGPAVERAQTEIREVIAPHLAGKDPRRWKDIEPPGKDPSLLKTFYAVQIALIDAAARYEQCPLSDLLGTRQRDRIKLYGSAGMYMSPEDYATEAAAVAAMGFKAYKMRPAAGPEKDIETVRRMREAVGPDFGLMVDAHAWWRMGNKSYSLDQVSEIARAMSACHPLWLEEPLPPDDHAAYRRLKGQSDLPLASGEHEQDEAGFVDLIQSGAVDVIQMDVCCQGGFAMANRLFDAISQKGLRFAFHSWGTTLEVLAAAHLGVCWPESVVEWLEFPCYANAGRPGMYPFPLADEILQEPLEIKEGDLVLPKAPGLGIEINEKVLHDYHYLPGPWSYFRTDSPPETVAVTGDHSVKWVGGPDV